MDALKIPIHGMSPLSSLIGKVVNESRWGFELPNSEHNTVRQ